MGSQKDVMELFAERDLRQIFSEHDGWKITPASTTRSGGVLYRISRSRWVGEEVAFVAASFTQVPSDETIAALDILPDGSNTVRIKKYLLTPQATDTSCIPPHVRVMPMQAFAFVQGELVWLTKKKNAKKFTAPEQAATA